MWDMYFSLKYLCKLGVAHSVVCFVLKFKQTFAAKFSKT